MRADKVRAAIERVANDTVCFVGDAIIDEYRYCTPLSKSPKENLIPVMVQSAQVFHGGVEAAANHARTFCKEVRVHSVKPATRKVRFVEHPYMRKVFEYQYQEDTGIDSSCGSMIGVGCDTVVVTDFGHGEIDKDVKQQIMMYCHNVAVNAQSNAANYGFNLITKYSHASYVVIDEPEARLAAHDRDSPIEDVIKKISYHGDNKFIVTLGSEGAIGYDGTRFARHPAFTKRVVDTMGAGDAFLAVTAPMAKYADLEELLVIGNAAGALKCEILGHRESVTKDHLLEFLGRYL